MNPNIFTFNNYIDYIKARVKSEKDNWGIWARLAEAAQCQPTYLSQALKEKVNLTSDHILGIAEYWKMSEVETDFFLLLLELERAGSKNLKNYISTKIRRIRSERENISSRLNKPRLEIGEKETLYYSTWYYAAIHVMVSIPEFRSATAIATRLMLPLDAVTFALEQLELHNIVKRDGKNWQLGTGDIHIPKNSALIGMHHSSWRQKAVLDSTLPNSAGIHYTGVYSISKKDSQHLKEKMLDLIEYSRKVIEPSKEEEIICFSCDLFEV